MKTIAHIAQSVLQTVSLPTQAPRTITNPVDLGFRLVGNESADEVKDLEAMHEAAQRFIADVKEGATPRWLTLYGKSGTGKTLLAKAVVEALRNELQGRYNAVSGQNGTNIAKCWSYAQEGPFLVKWGRVINFAREGNYGPFQRTCNDWFKVIDDIGSEGFSEKNGEIRPTAFVISKLGELFDRRLGKWTIVTTNFTRRDFASLFDVRIASRLTRDGNEIAECVARDWAIRLEQRQRDERDNPQVELL